MFPLKMSVMPLPSAFFLNLLQCQVWVSWRRGDVIKRRLGHYVPGRVVTNSKPSSPLCNEISNPKQAALS